MDPRVTIEVDLASIKAGDLRRLCLRWLDKNVHVVCPAALALVHFDQEAQRLTALPPVGEETLSTTETVVASVHHSLVRATHKSPAHDAVESCLSFARDAFRAARPVLIPTDRRALPERKEVIFARSISSRLIVSAARVARARALLAGADPREQEEAAAALEKEAQTREALAARNFDIA
jgi:hypothetical protein